MKKLISSMLNIAVSFLLSAAVLLLLLRVGSGASDLTYDPVSFSEDGDVLHFFGETLYISRDDLMGILSYPSDSLKFCMKFLPNSVIISAKSLASSVASNCRDFVSLVFGAADSFLKLGTSL